MKPDSTIDRPLRPGTMALALWCGGLGLLVFGATLLTVSFHNDHFMHVVLGQQILQGRLRFLLT